MKNFLRPLLPVLFVMTTVVVSATNIDNIFLIFINNMTPEDLFSIFYGNRALGLSYKVARYFYYIKNILMHLIMYLCLMEHL